MSPFRKLNANQREAVLHGEGPLLILAGAGSGKTSVMSHRIAHLISAKNVPPYSILGLSFTNRAANELKDRVYSLLGGVSSRSERSRSRARAKGLIVSTFHSLCVRILRAHGEKLGYSPNFTILDSSDQVDVVRQVLRNIRIDDRKFDPDAILFQIGQAKHKFLSPEASEAFFLATRRPGDQPTDYAIATASAYPRYQAQLKALNAMDFDDLLYNAVQVLEKHDDVRESYNQIFRYILVDEYQDTNLSQFRLLRLLTERVQNLCVVGDDDQSIYAWRGADPSHILEFTNHFPGAQVITLEQNYRSTTTILDAANAVIQGNKKRHPKKLWSDKGEGESIQQIIVEDDRAEGELVADEIIKLKRDWRDFAVLYRSNSQSRIFEESMRMRKIPYKIVGGMSFLERKEIKDILCYWRLIVNPNDDPSLRRIINWPARGIGKTTIQTVSEKALREGTSFFNALENTESLPARAREPIGKFRALILEMRKEIETLPVNPESISGWARRTLDLIGARRGIEEDHDDPVQVANRFENIEELANSMGQLHLDEIPSEGAPLTALVVLREYLSRLALDAKDEKEEDDETEKNQVTLLTLHGAKGLEFPVVFMVGAEEGFLPHKRTIEEGTDLSEERRLCYVGITRAKELLFITRANARVRYGKAVPRNASRFLDEVPVHLMQTRNESAGPDLSSVEAVEKHEQKVTDFLSQIRNRLQNST